MESMSCGLTTPMIKRYPKLRPTAKGINVASDNSLRAMSNHTWKNGGWITRTIEGLLEMHEEEGDVLSFNDNSTSSRIKEKSAWMSELRLDELWKQMEQGKERRTPLHSARTAVEQRSSPATLRSLGAGQRPDRGLVQRLPRFHRGPPRNARGPRGPSALPLLSARSPRGPRATGGCRSLYRK